MRYLKLYENFEEINHICDKYNIFNYSINQDGSIDVNDSVYLSKKNLLEIPLKFGKVLGVFYCANNQLTSLKNSPIEAHGFNCNDTKLTSLLGGPKKVKNNYWCRRNDIKDFVGFPEHFLWLFVTGNPIEKILNLVFEDHQQKFIFWLNEYDVIRDGNKIVEMRLEEAYWMTMKKELPMNKRTFKNYTLI